jgi:hypothetical protein
MTELIIQYILIVIMVLAVGYLTYFLKEKGVIIKNDYFGISYTILGMLTNSEASMENVKRILRIVSGAVQMVEENLVEADNKLKEDKAFEIARESLKSLNLNNEIGEKSIRYIIRLSCAIQPSSREVASDK